MKPQIQKLLTVLFVVFTGCLVYTLSSGKLEYINLCFGLILLVVVFSKAIDIAKYDGVLLTSLMLFFTADMLSVQNSGNKLFMYYLLNGLSVLAYAFLTYWLLLKNSLRKLIFKNKILAIVSFLVSVVLFYFFTVNALTDKAEFFSYMHLMEALYNLAIMILLNVVILNYAYFNDTKKGLFSLLFCLSLIISEFIQLAYYLSVDVVTYFPELMTFICFFKFLSLLFCFRYSMLNTKTYNSKVLIVN